jgi:hypothetical protein
MRSQRNTTETDLTDIGNSIAVKKETAKLLVDIGFDPTRLVQAIALDIRPSPATMCDFGIKTTAHLAALQETRATAYDLDRVLGDGQAITQLVRMGAGNRFKHVHFETPTTGITSWSCRRGRHHRA